MSSMRRQLVNAYEIKAGIGVIAGSTVWSMPERLESELLHKVRYINTLTFTFTATVPPTADPHVIRQRGWQTPYNAILPAKSGRRLRS